MGENVSNCDLHETFLHWMNGNNGYYIDGGYNNLGYLTSCSYDENHKSHVNENNHNVSPVIFVVDLSRGGDFLLSLSRESRS